ncbi:MAG: hypothetical protein EAZ43_14200 [Betaproteobacteria bacterium]|nr:MAG: hypothetical protein EAZ43_14200 [Betaproteobacteria bacterium]
MALISNAVAVEPLLQHDQQSVGAACREILRSTPTHLLREPFAASRSYKAFAIANLIESI